MNGRTPWLERRWSFDLSVERDVAALRERLRSAPERAATLVSGLSDEQQLRRVDGTWSIRTNLGHLADLERLLATRIDDFIARRPALAAWTGNQGTDVEGHEARSGDELCAAFRLARAATSAKLAPLAPADYARAALHPRLHRPMRLIDLCSFHAEHDDHHLDRVRELAGRFERGAE